MHDMQVHNSSGTIIQLNFNRHETPNQAVVQANFKKGCLRKNLIGIWKFGTNSTGKFNLFLIFFFQLWKQI